MDWLMPFREIVEFIIRLLERLSILRAILGFMLVFFLPGFAWTLVLFSQINILERVALSFGLSIALVTLSLFTVNLLFGVRITGLNSILVIILITIPPLAAFYFDRFMKRKRGIPKQDH
ncbi:MAG: DUF1616 domain-containing protein [Dehalococcoidales bacterium]|nr:DUF1616 domain-containing protein [Dehalococcoidales bacterium]